MVKYNIFSRINQGGLKLTPQEIRHALHQVTSADLVADLVRSTDAIREDGTIDDKKMATEEGKAFVKVTEGKIRTKRMEDRNFATRFVSFYLIDYKEYEPDMDSFMNRGMGKIKELKQEGIRKLKDDFKAAVELAYEIFGNDAFRKRLDLAEPRKPINKAIFEVFSVLIAKLSIAERMVLADKKERLKSEFMEFLRNDKERYFQSVTTGTALKDMVYIRFSLTEKMILKTLAHHRKP